MQIVIKLSENRMEWSSVLSSDDTPKVVKTGKRLVKIIKPVLFVCQYGLLGAIRRSIGWWAARRGYNGAAMRLLCGGGKKS